MKKPFNHYLYKKILKVCLSCYARATAGLGYMYCCFRQYYCILEIATPSQHPYPAIQLPGVDSRQYRTQVLEILMCVRMRAHISCSHCERWLIRVFYLSDDRYERFVFF